MTLWIRPDCDPVFAEKVRNALKEKGLTWEEQVDDFYEQSIQLDAFFGDFSNEDIFEALNAVTVSRDGVVRYRGESAEDVDLSILKNYGSPFDRMGDANDGDDVFCGYEETNDPGDK